MLAENVAQILWVKEVSALGWRGNARYPLFAAVLGAHARECRKDERQDSQLSGPEFAEVWRSYHQGDSDSDLILPSQEP